MRCLKLLAMSAYDQVQYCVKNVCCFMCSDAHEVESPVIFPRATSRIRPITGKK